MRPAGLAIVGLLLVAPFSCKVAVKARYYDDDRKAALAALEALHSRLDAGDFEAIYKDAGDALRARRPKADILASMRATRDRWGKLLKSELKATSCLPGEEVRMVVQTQFEKGEAGELIVWHVPDGKAHLQHFQIFPGRAQLSAGKSNECRSR